MLKKDTKIRSSEGPEFNCYVVTPEKEQKVPAVVLASAIHGVDKDLRAIADELASRGYIAAAPDLFWRSVPGPLVRDDPRSAPRGQPPAFRATARRCSISSRSSRACASRCASSGATRTRGARKRAGS